MTAAQHTPLPLVSVIIPCYNHGRYLQEALDSVYRQSYKKVEIIVVDDGSSDNTKEVARNNENVTYIYQTNKGLSAARNTGIRNSSGEFLLFLDADDWLLPEALQTNVQLMVHNPGLAFVSGGHQKVFMDTGRKEEENLPVPSDHYRHFLLGNYIGMHAVVLYRRRILEEFSFDESLRACEDYDLYCKIARKFPVAHHTQTIAAYRIHHSNMSGNIPFMLEHVEKVLNRQKDYLYTDAEKKACKKGLQNWKAYYADQLYKQLTAQKASVTSAAFFTLLRVKPLLAFRYFFKKLLS